ncbi:MAG: PepSY domain-containing protein [Ideonella sp.]|nr:PepSY domain-containing protein [Ideonella sp.]MCC7459245.1 PepSY domain-containing protein [Nitrospira sp.]
MKTHRFVIAVALCAATTAVLADDDCDVPLQAWQPREAALQAAAQRGWQVQRLKIDDGCYEIRGRDAQGRAFEAKLDPRTLQPVKMKLRDGDRRERERNGHERDPERKRQRGDAASGAPASGAPVTPGTTPRATIE